MNKLLTIALLLSLPLTASAGGLFPEQPAPMSPGYGATGGGLHSAMPNGVPNEACITNPVSMDTGRREYSVTTLTEGDLFTIPTTLLFDFDEYVVRPEGREDLANVYQLLTEGGATRISVTGHTDSKGSTEHNEVLGMNRAKAVAAVLMGLGLDVVESNSAGELEPVAPNTLEGRDYPEGRQANRRVVIEVLEVEPQEVTETVVETFPRNPQIFHVMSSNSSVDCSGSVPYGRGYIFNGYYPSYQIYGNGQFLR